MNGWQEVEDNNPLDVKSLNPEPSGLKSGLKDAGEFLLGLGTKAAQAPFNLASLPMNILDSLGVPRRPSGSEEAEAKLPEKLKGLANPGRPTDILQRIPQQIEDTVERMFGKGSTKPTNIVSQAAQATVGNLPLLALTGGGLTAPKVASDLVGSFFQSGAQNLGVGAMGQIVASSLGQAGFGKIAGLFTKSLKNPSVLNDYKANLYTKESELGSKFKVPTDELRTDLISIKDKLSLQFPHKYKFSSEAKANVNDIIDIVDKKLRSPAIKGSDLFQIQKDLNQVYLKPTSVEGKYFNQVRGAVMDSLNKASKKNDVWGATWKEADKIHSLQNWQSGLSDGLDKIASQGRTEKVLNNKVGKYALALLSSGTNVLDAAIEQGSRPALLLNHLRGSKDGQKVIWDIVANSAKGNSNALAKSLHTFNKMADQYESDQPSSNGWEDA